MSKGAHHSRPEIDEAHPFLLRSIELDNFKSVQRAQVVLSPLSVIVGANSSGKSTLFQSILTICQTATTRGNTGDIYFNGDYQRLGTFRDVMNFRVPYESPELEPLKRDGSLAGEAAYQELEKQSQQLTDALSYSMKMGFCIATPKQVINWHISILESGKDRFRGRISNLRIQANNDAIPVYIHCDSLGDITIIDLWYEEFEADNLPPLDPHERDDILAAIGNGPSEWSNTREGPSLQEGSHEYPPTVLRDMEASRLYAKVSDVFHLESPRLIEDSPLTRFRIQIQDVYSGGDQWNRTFLIGEGKSVLADAEENYWLTDFLATVSAAITEVFGSNVAYLGPLRAAPSKMAQSTMVPRGTSLGNNGEHTAAVLDSVRNKTRRVPLPDSSDRMVRLGEAMNHWLKWFGLADDVTVRRARRSVDLSVDPPGSATSVDLSSVGVGVSQVLPVILLCLLSKPADVLILEQPELHLHPALQKRLADFLLVFVRAGRQILVETHSDHLVNQLRYQVASDATDEMRHLVKLIFTEQTDGITTYRESEINEYGGLSEDWPDGFLDISARSAQDLVRQSLRKMKVRTPEPAKSN